MAGIVPTLGIINTGRNVRTYTRKNMDAFWNILNPLLPWILGLTFFDLIINIAFPFFNGKFALGELITAYFYTCFVISWHRVVLEGPDTAVPVNPFKPERSDWAFIGMGVGLGIAVFLMILFSGFLMALNPAVGGISVLIAVLAIIICFPKFSLYFPAKAVRRHMSLKESFKATNGLVFKILSAPVVASWRIFLAIFAYFIGIGVIMAVTIKVLGGIEAAADNPMLAILGCLFSLPVLIYFQPVGYALGVGVLSNYYRYAIENKSA